MSSLSNAVEPSTLSNYFGEAAITMLFGMGFYLVNKFKKDDKQSKSKETQELSSSNEFVNITSLSDFHLKIKENTSKTPYEILNLMINLKLSPSIETYNLLIFNACKNGYFSEAKRLKEEIFDMTSPIYPDIQTFNLLIKGLHLEYISKRSETSENIKNSHQPMNSIALEEFDKEISTLRIEMKTRGISPSVETENIYLNILHEQNRNDAALNYFDFFHRTCEFDIYTFTIALRIIRSIVNDFHYNRKTDKTISTGNYNYSRTSNKQLFNYLSKYSDKISVIKDFVDKKLNEIKDSQDHRLQVPKGDFEGYVSGLIDAFIALKDHESAKKAFVQYSPHDEASFVSLIRVYTIEKNLKLAIESFLSLKKNKFSLGKTPTISGYGAILNACAKLDNMNLAEEILQEMFSHKIFPNSHVYSTVINGYRLSGRFDLALQAYKLAEMDKENYNIAVLNTILNACAEENEFKTLYAIYDEAIEKYKIIPDKITFSVLIKSYSKHQEFDKLWDLYSYLLKNKIYDEITFNSLLDTFANAEHESNLYEIYTEMKNNKINVSVVTYGVLLKFYVNQANKERSEEIYQEILRKNITPSIVIFQLMIKLYAYLGYYNKIWNIYKSMVNKYNLTPDFQLYDSLIRIGLKNNDLIQVKTIILDASKNEVFPEKHLIDSFFTKLFSAEDINRKSKMAYSNEISIAYSKQGRYLSKKAYQIMDSIFHKSQNNYSLNPNSHNNNNKYDCIFEEINEARQSYFKDYYSFGESHIPNSQCKTLNANFNFTKNKFDIGLNDISSELKPRFESLQNIYSKSYGYNKVGQSIYSEN